MRANASGLVSAPSKEKVLRAQDRIAPPQVVDLAASALPGVAAQGEVADASGEFSSYWAASNAFDGRHRPRPGYRRVAPRVGSGIADACGSTRRI